MIRTAARTVALAARVSGRSVGRSRAVFAIGALRAAAPGVRAARRSLAGDAGSHSDFEPQIKVSPDADVHERIAKEVNSHSLVLFMKGTPAFPQCGFSQAVARVLEAEGVSQYRAINVLDDPDVREGVKKFSDWPTIPQLYIQGEFVGGCDIVLDLHKSGELQAMLKGAGAVDA